MAILTIGVVLQNWLEDKTGREAFNLLIRNSIIREVSIFRNAKKDPITLDQVKEFTDEIRKLRPDIDFAVDQEGGLVQRLRGDGFTPLPKPGDLRQLYEEGQPGKALRIAEACGVVTAYELGQAGINILYGPVFDTYNPDSVVIGKIGRSYGNPPDSTNLLKHYLKGINGCLYSIAKHFPDHGQVINDTHIKMAIDTRSVEDISTQSLPPYEKLNYDALMVPHVIYSAVDELPASLSKKTIDLFVGKLGKKSVLFSDALEMKALASIAPTMNERVERCLNSGCDAILYCGGGGKPEPDYLEQLKALLTFIAEKKQTDPTFLDRYQAAEEKIAQLAERKLNELPTLEAYDDAKQIIKENLVPEPTE